MRNAINNLQAVVMSKGLVNKQNVFDICDVPNSDKIQEMIGFIKIGDLNKTIQIFCELWAEDYCNQDLINYLARNVENTQKMEFDMRFEMMKLIGELKINNSKCLGTKC